MTLQSVGAAVKNDNNVFFVPLCLRARNGFIGSAQGCPDCPKWGYREF